MSKHRIAECFAQGSVACITGASSGIGKAVSLACARRGMHVFMADVDVAELNAAASAVTGLGSAASVNAVPTDVADPAALGSLRAGQKYYDSKR